MVDVFGPRTPLLGIGFVQVKFEITNLRFPGPTPLTDGMVADEIAFEGFEAVTGWDGEIGELTGPVHLDQLSQGDTGDGVEAPVLFLGEKLLGVSVREVADHLTDEGLRFVGGLGRDVLRFGKRWMRRLGFQEAV